MPLDSDLNTLCDYLRGRLAMNVAGGRPDENVPGIYVWPWRIVPKPEIRNSLPHSHSGPGVVSFRVNCLLFITPADTLESLAKLDLAGQAIQANPILEGAAGRLRVTLDPIGTEELAALFIAARLQLTLCLPFALEGSPPS